MTRAATRERKEAWMRKYRDQKEHPWRTLPGAALAIVPLPPPLPDPPVCLSHCHPNSIIAVLAKEFTRNVNGAHPTDQNAPTGSKES